MTEGAVGNLEAAEGRRAEPFASVGVGDDAMIIMCSRSRMTDCLFFLAIVTVTMTVTLWFYGVVWPVPDKG
jgi:hypothetical protein